MDQEAKRRIMLQESIPRLVCRLSIPTVLIQMITVIYNTADTFFISKISTSASAAVGVVFSLMAIIHAFGFGIGMGANSIISRKLGANKNDEADQFASSALFAAFLVGTLILICGLCNLKGLMRLLGSTETMLPYSCDYAKYILVGAPIMCASFVLNNILRAEGDAFFSMFGMCTGGVLNTILDPWLIFGLHMGISGAALATVLSQAISFCILFSFFLTKKSIVHIRMNKISFHKEEYILIIKNGFPTICRQGLASIASALLNIQAAVYGDCAVAAITIANKIYMLVRNVVLGIGQGAQPVLGYNYGALQYKRLKKVFHFSCFLGSMFCISASILISGNAVVIMQWFRNDEEVIRIGTETLKYVCLVMPFMAYSTYVNQVYQGLGFSMGATFLASCRQGIFFVPYILLLPKILACRGIEMSQPMADFSTFIISVPFQIYLFKKCLKEKSKGL